MELFYDSVSITIGDGKTAKFWDTPWLDGLKPENLAPSVLAISKKKTFTVQKAMSNDLASKPLF